MSESTKPVLVRCDSCDATVPSGAYCAICGRLLTARGAATTSPAPWYAPDGPVRSVGRRLTGVYAAGAVAVVIASVLVFGGRDTHTVTGNVALFDSDMVDLSVGNPCHGSGGYDDLHGGQRLTIEDGTGRMLATTELESGEFDGLSCVFDFALQDVAKADFYRVSTGRAARGELQYSYEEMVGTHWAINIVIGD